MSLSYYTKLVLEALKASDKAKDDDKFLYGFVCVKIANKEFGDGYNYLTKMTFVDVMTNKLYPAPETISRIRRKLQNQFPELAGKRKRERMERQAEFVQYAKSSVDEKFGDCINGTTDKCM